MGVVAPREREREREREMFINPTHEAVSAIKTPYPVPFALIILFIGRRQHLQYRNPATGGVRVSHDVQTRIVDVMANTCEAWSRKDVRGVIRFYG